MMGKISNSMLIQETAKMNPFLQDIAVSTMLKDRLSALSTLLKSRHVLYSVAKEQGLIDDDMGAKEQEFIIKDYSPEDSFMTTFMRAYDDYSTVYRYIGDCFR